MFGKSYQYQPTLPNHLQPNMTQEKCISRHYLILRLPCLSDDLYDRQNSLLALPYCLHVLGCFLFPPSFVYSAPLCLPFSSLSSNLYHLHSCRLD